MSGAKCRRLQERLRPGLEIDGLPNAAGVAVALFALELEGASAVVHAQHEAVVLARLEVRRELELEGRVAAAMGAQRLAVQPGLGFPVAGADDQEHPLALPLLGCAHSPRIPGDGRLVRHSDRGEPQGNGTMIVVGNRPARGPLLGKPTVSPGQTGIARGR